MGEIVEFPRARQSDREGCASWRHGQETRALIARPACAALAMALAAAATSASPRIGTERVAQQDSRTSATIHTMATLRAAR